MGILEKVVMNKKIGVFTLLSVCLMLMCGSAFASPLSELGQMAQNAKQSIENSANNALQNNDNKLVGRSEDEKVQLNSLTSMAKQVADQANKISAEKLKQFTQVAKDLGSDGSEIKKAIKSGKISSKDFAGMLNQLFTDFDKQKAQEVDYNNAKYRNPGFIEDEDEIYNIKDTLKGYDLLSDEEVEKLKKDKTEKKNDAAVANWMQIYYLFYNSPNDWKCKINNHIITNETEQKLTDNTTILRVNKNSIIFLLNTISDTYLENIKRFKEKKYAYSENYHIFTDIDGKQYVVFKLYAGQKIDLDTMQISR
jgi:hypothetical protein